MPLFISIIVLRILAIHEVKFCERLPSWISAALPRFRNSFILLLRVVLACLLRSHCAEGELKESISKTGKYSQYPAGVALPIHNV